MYDGLWKTLEACCMGRGCQGEEVALGIQRDRRGVDGGEPMARRQKHVAHSLDLPFNNVGGLGWEDRAGLRPRGGGGTARVLSSLSLEGLSTKVSCVANA
jgi:hypothetical protein